MLKAAGLSMLISTVNFARHGGWHSNFLLAFPGVLELHVFWIDVIDYAQISSIVELRLFNSPFVSESCLTILLAMYDRA